MAQIGPQYFPRPTGLLFQSKPLAPPALSHEEVLNKSGDADRRLTSSACIFVNQPGFACTGEFGGGSCHVSPLGPCQTFAPAAGGFGNGSAAGGGSSFTCPARAGSISAARSSPF